jgi:hypothetical protein
MTTKIGEVIESSTAEFTAECYELYNIPPLGSLVKTVNSALEIYGVVCQAKTSSVEPGRRPIARGKDEGSEEAVYQSNPQLTKLLRSEFQILVAGYQLDGKMYQRLPSVPAHIHAFVNLCRPEEVKQFSQSFEFLSILTNTRLPISLEDTIAAALREMSSLQADPHAFLVSAGKSLTALHGSDYQRLKTILMRLK